MVLKSFCVIRPRTPQRISYIVYHGQNYLHVREETITVVFTAAMKHYQELATYFNDENQDDLTKVARALPIWRKPVPNLDSPRVWLYLFM